MDSSRLRLRREPRRSADRALDRQRSRWSVARPLTRRRAAHTPLPQTNVFSFQRLQCAEMIEPTYAPASINVWRQAERYSLRCYPHYWNPCFLTHLRTPHVAGYYASTRENV